MGAPGPSHLGTRETANPNQTIPEFLTFRLYHRQLGSNPYFGPSQNLRQPTNFGVRDGLPTNRPEPGVRPLSVRPSVGKYSRSPISELRNCLESAYSRFVLQRERKSFFLWLGIRLSIRVGRGVSRALMIRSKPTTARILLFFCFAVLVVFVMGHAQTVATSPSENSQQRPKLRAVASDSIPGPFVADEKSIRKLNEILKQRLGQESAQPHFSYKVTFSDHSYYETDSLDIVLTEENPISRQIIAIELKGTGAPTANGDDPVSALVVLGHNNMSYSIQGGDRDWVINTQTEIIERLHLLSLA